MSKIFLGKLENLLRRLQSFGATAWCMLFARILQNVNGFILSMIIVKKFGLSAAGSLTIAMIGTAVFGTFCTFGLPFVFARSKEPIGVRNFVGLATSFAAILVSLPFCVGLGLLFGRDHNEAAVILLFSLGGAYFALTAITNALLVLQNRAADVILSPLANLLGLLVGFALTNDLLTFALVLTVARFVGGFATFGRLGFERASPTIITAYLRRGVDFLTADTISLVSDQGSVMLASGLLAREELGIFGLCRQMITVSDTPAASSIAIWYPRLCQNPREALPAFKNHMLLLGIFCAISLAALSAPLGLFIYHLPRFVWLAPLLITSVPFRYLIGATETALRALGLFSAIRQLTFIRCVVCGFLPIGVLLAGIDGAIIATIVQMIVTFWLVKRLLDRHCSKEDRMELDEQLSSASGS